MRAVAVSWEREGYELKKRQEGTWGLMRAFGSVQLPNPLSRHARKWDHPRIRDPSRRSRRTIEVTGGILVPLTSLLGGFVDGFDNGKS